MSPSTVSEFPIPLITNTMRTTGGFVSSTTNSILDTFSQASPTTDSVDTPTTLKTLATVVVSNSSINVATTQSGSTSIPMNNSGDTPGSSSPTTLKTLATGVALNSSSVATTQSGSTPIPISNSVVYTPGSSLPTTLKTLATGVAPNSSSVATTQGGSPPIQMNGSVVPAIFVVILLIILVSVGAITVLLVYKR